MGKFNINSLLSSTSRSGGENETERDKKQKPKYTLTAISVHDLVPSKDNFYSMGQINELKMAIELAGGVKQNLNVIPLGDGKHKVVAGHRRRLASLELVKEGKTEYEYLPCAVETKEEDAEVQNIKEELMLILTNSQRDKTDWDKVEEVRRLRVALEKYKKSAKLPGRIREIIAETLNTSPSQVGRMDSIAKHLTPEFKEEFKGQKVNISTAYELSTLPTETQQKAFEEYRQSGNISISNVKERKAEVKTGEEGISGKPTETDTIPGEVKAKPEEEGTPEPREEEEGQIENEQPQEEHVSSTVFEALKALTPSKLAEFICFRCKGAGSFCDFAARCSKSKEEERHGICAQWLDTKVRISG